MNHNYFKNKYLINSSRLLGQDYSTDGFYFFTVCTKNRKCFLGEVKQGIMGLSDIGCIVWEEWLKTGQIRNNIRLDQFIVMPNHIHGIIEICDNPCRDVARNVSTNMSINQQMSNISPKAGSLSTIIRAIKSACTKHIHELGYQNFSWQERFYDHVIKLDSNSLEKIRWYIKYNPSLWDRDRNNPVNIKI